MNRPRSRRLLVVTAFYPGHGGGIESVAWQLVQRLATHDPHLRIEWLASDCDPPPRHPRVGTCPLSSWNAIERKTGLPVPCPSPGALERLWRAVRRADVVHIHDFAYASNIAAALMCLASGTPYVLTQHVGAVPMKHPFFERALEKLNSQLGARLLQRARASVFVSNEVRSYFAARGLTGGELVPNGVDTQVFCPATAQERAALREREGLSPQAPVAVFAGRFVPKKGVPFVLELAAATPGITWILAGHGPLDPGDQPLPNVRVERHRRGASLADLFRLADVLVLPSRGEGFPLVVQEALACGTAALVEESLARALPGVAPHLDALSLEGADALGCWRTQLEAIGARETPAHRGARAEFAARAWSWEGCAHAYHALLFPR